MPSLLADLNSIQQEAVKKVNGPVLVLAGAGSGKTRVLTYKAAYLIKEKKVDPQNILLTTFTNKASQEMADRIVKLVEDSNSRPIMGTFHSISAKILRKDGHFLGLPIGFSIYDENDALDAIKQAMEKLVIPTKKLSPQAIRSTISQAKNENISDLEYPQYTRGPFQETVARVYIEYQKILRENQALDFDDLLMYVIRLFQNHPEILSKYQNQFQYILVDEYQDTNATQYLLVKLLAKKNRNICVVGDASQSIYSFRGADFRNIVNFKKDYPQALVFNLEQNYRSTQVILDAAFSVISVNKSHPILSLWTEKNGGDKIKIFQAANEIEEAMYVLKEIKSSNLTLSSFAILYRTNAQSRSLEEVFLKSGVPYILVGGVKFYERKEIKDVLAYLRLVQNPKDSVSLKRIEKIGKGRMNRFLDWSSSVVLGITTLELMDQILEVTNYLETLDDGTEQGKLRIENVKELKSVALEFPDLIQFLENVSLVQDAHFPDKTVKADKNQKSSEAATFMTIHASKGLEFPVVFLVGMEEGLFPHSRAMLNPHEMEEERRLAYVGITRAKEKLYMIYTRSRMYFGQKSSNLVSRFLSSIPEGIIDSSDIITERLSEKLPDYYHGDDWLN